MITSDDLERFVKMNEVIHRTVNDASAGLYKALAMRDAGAMKVAARRLRDVTASATAISAAINELAERL